MPASAATLRKWLVVTAWIAAAAVAFSGTLLTFVVVDGLAGRALALLAGFGTLVVLPAALTSVAARVARRLGRPLAEGRFALLSAAPLGALTVLVWCTAGRSAAANALVEAPERLGPGWLGDASAALGARLGGKKPTAAHAAASTPSSRGAGPRGTSAAAHHGPPPSGGRYAAGDAGYREVADCTALSDVEDLADKYRPDALRATAEALATRRYPEGVAFLHAQDDAMLNGWFAGAPTFGDLAMRFDVAVHEGSHVWGFKHFGKGGAGGPKYVYRVHRDLTIEMPMLSNFARSAILSRHPDPSSDTYAHTYLEGKSGNQGFNTLLDEYNAYTHTLAARYCTRDLMPQGAVVSARDGILAMMFYVGTYLHIARTEHPADYAAILKDKHHRKLILTVWDRAEYWLRKSAGEPGLGMHDEMFEGWAYGRDNLAEIARVRAKGHK